MAKEYDKPVAMDWVENPNTGKHHTVFETGAPSIENGKVILPGYTSLIPIEEVDQQQESNHPEVPKDRSSNPKRTSGYQDELAYYAGKVGPDTRATRAARHAKPGGIVHGDYPATPTGPAIGGKHGKSWNGKD